MTLLKVKALANNYCPDLNKGAGTVVPVFITKVRLIEL